MQHPLTTSTVIFSYLRVDRSQQNSTSCQKKKKYLEHGLSSLKQFSRCSKNQKNASLFLEICNVFSARNKFHVTSALLPLKLEKAALCRGTVVKQYTTYTLSFL